MEKRGFLGIPFAWLFAIVVGAFILFLAIYASTKFIDTEKIVLDAKTAKEIGVLLNPLETSFESASTTQMSSRYEMRIYAKCSDEGDFGKQQIQVLQKSFDSWSDTNTKVSFPNKYIFSEQPVEGKTFYIFSKPFKFPFKVADLIYLTSSKDKYCFIDPSEGIEDEIKDIEQKNLVLATPNCPENSIKVCFESGTDCDIEVNENSGIVKKDGDTLRFEGDALMYAAIFSEKETYECQLKRLMMRVKELSVLYIQKSASVKESDCNTNLEGDLQELINLAENFDIGDLSSIDSKKDAIEMAHKNIQCRLW